MPNFSYEWEEALRYPELEAMGKNGWHAIANAGYEFQVTKDSLSNISNTTAISTPGAQKEFIRLDSDKQERFNTAFQSGTIEMPIVVKFSSNGAMDLLGGNTRYTGLVANGIMPKVWMVDVDDND